MKEVKKNSYIIALLIYLIQFLTGDDFWLASDHVLLWFTTGLFVLLVMPGLDMLKRSTTKQFK